MRLGQVSANAACGIPPDRLAAELDVEHLAFLPPSMRRHDEVTTRRRVDELTPSIAASIRT